jgi:hypothetical protein
MTNIGVYCSKGSLDHELESYADEKMNVTLTCSKCNQTQFFQVGYQFDEIIKNEQKS